MSAPAANSQPPAASDDALTISWWPVSWRSDRTGYHWLEFETEERQLAFAEDVERRLDVAEVRVYAPLVFEPDPEVLARFRKRAQLLKLGVHVEAALREMLG